MLVCPTLKFDTGDLDAWTPNKKAVVAYSRFASFHGPECLRQKNVVYVNVRRILGWDFQEAGTVEEAPIATGDTIRIVSDGVYGYVYKLAQATANTESI